jgi:hypothetical protein
MQPLKKKAGFGSGAEAGSESVSQWYGPANPDPYPYQNVTDSQHWKGPGHQTLQRLIISLTFLN